MERFLNPSILFYANDSRVQCEYSYLQYYGDDPFMVQRIRDHWDSWVTEEDIKKLARIGFTHVRLPIGPEVVILN